MTKQQRIDDLLQKWVIAWSERDEARDELAAAQALIIEAASAFRLDGGTDTLAEASASLVRMCHEGAAALKGLAATQGR